MPAAAGDHRSGRAGRRPSDRRRSVAAPACGVNAAGLRYGTRMGLENPLHILLLLVVILLVFGAKRLPEIGRSLGEGMRGFKDSLSGDSSQHSLTSAPSAAAPVAHAMSTAPAAAPAPAAPVAAAPPVAPVAAGVATHDDAAAS